MYQPAVTGSDMVLGSGSRVDQSTPSPGGVKPSPWTLVVHCRLP